jgi:hypothetical protein
MFKFRGEPMPNTVEACTEPCARKTIFAAFKEAAEELWGPSGLQELAAKLPEEVRRDTVESTVLPVWLPERYVMAWYEAAWAGPAKQRREPYLALMDRMMDAGFGRVRKLLLSTVASPRQVYEKSAELWRYDHTTGDLTTVFESERSCRFVLRNHVYATTELSRDAIAEIYRYAVALTRAGRGAQEQHALEPDGTLVTRVAW